MLGFGKKKDSDWLERQEIRIADLLRKADANRDAKLSCEEMLRTETDPNERKLIEWEMKQFAKAEEALVREARELEALIREYKR